MVTFTDCQKNPDSDVCKESCTASTGAPPTTPGFSKENCNVLYSQFCADPTNQARPICACSLPWSSYPNSAQVTQYFPNVQEPVCWFAGCKATGYHKDVPGNICPACIATLNVDITNATQSGVAGIAQTCSVSSTTGGAAASSTTSSGATATTTTAATDPRAASDVLIDDAESLLEHHFTAFAVGGAAAVGLVLLVLLFRK